ncbi:MAG: hypothetical protein J6R40_04940 [Clostridia bacterium]|nr:hypothetical protein [Clostridia bacterium]
MKDKFRLSTREMVLFSALTAILFLSDIALEVAMNVELVSTLLAAYTVVFRQKALVILYLYVALYLLIFGFGMYNLAYLYIWLVLWGVFMLLPKNGHKVLRAILYPVCCALFGFAFGALYIPAWALAFSLGIKESIAWWIAGIPADMIHAAGNFAFGFLILPLSDLLISLQKKARFR